MLGYVKIGDIEGMATTKGHEKWIPIEGLFHGANRNVADGSNDPVADLRNSRVQIGGIQMSKLLDASTPKLFEAVCNGEVFKEVTFNAVRATAKTGDEVFYTIKLINAFIKSYDANGSAMAGGNVSMTENLSLGFEKIQMSYKILDATGKTQGSSDARWNLAKSDAS